MYERRDRPTIRILEIGQFASPSTQDQLKTFLPSEAPETVRRYLDGRIDQWYARHIVASLSS
jgi:hypothetical protein